LAFKRYQPEFFGLPALVNIDANTTGRELYELVWMRIRYMLKQSATENTEVLWWRNQDSIAKIKVLTTSEGRRRLPFIIKYVNQTGNQCSLCHWTSRCLGCTLLPTNSTDCELMPSNEYIPSGLETSSLFEFLKTKNHWNLTLDWDIDFVNQFFVYENCFKPQEHASVGKVKEFLSRKIDLADCLKLFNVGDTIEARCSPCKEETKNINTVSV